MNPVKTAPFGSSLIKVHIVCNKNISRQKSRRQVVTGRKPVEEISQHTRFWYYIVKLSRGDSDEPAQVYSSPEPLILAKTMAQTKN